MILTTSVMLNSLEYSESQNIKITAPYLIYYSLLNCCRAILLTQPLTNWKEGELFRESHSKISTLSENMLSEISPKFRDGFINRLNKARDVRESFSYKFPANGLSNYKDFPYLDSILINHDCSLLSELVQFNSEILCSVIDQENPIINYEENKMFFEFAEDEEDYYRLSKHLVKYKKPYDIQTTLTEGLVEDFFGVWTPIDHELTNEQFNPDSNWRIIFDFY